MLRHASRLALIPLMLVIALLSACDGGVDVPKTADLAVLRVANGIAENKPVVIWDALPESYQKDIHELVHNAIGKVDAKFYDDVAGVAKKVTKILKEKKQFILNHPQLAQSMPNKAEVEKQWDGLVSVLENILTSELGSYESAKKVNLGALLDTTGAKIMGDVANAAKLAGPGENPEGPNEYVEMIDKLKKIKATLVKEEGDKATVKMSVPGEKETEEEFVRIEGKWLPKEMVDGWKEMMTEARAELSKMDAAELKKNTDQAAMIIGMLNGALDSLDKVKTQEEFNNIINGFMENMMGGGAGPKGDDF